MPEAGEKASAAAAGVTLPLIESSHKTYSGVESLVAVLQVLWAEERAEKSLTARQSFVDLGCGNGLLVHILANEGVS